MKILIILLLLCSTAYAADLMANGYDYVLMSDNQKTELVSNIYKIFQRNETPEDTVVALDGLYYMYENEVKTDPKIKDKQYAIEAVFSKPVMEIISELMTMKPPTSYDEEFLKKYGLTLKK